MNRIPRHVLHSTALLGDDRGSSMQADLAIHARKVDDVRGWFLDAFEGGPSGRLRKYRVRSPLCFQSSDNLRRGREYWLWQVPLGLEKLLQFEFLPAKWVFKFSSGVAQLESLRSPNSRYSSIELQVALLFVPRHLLQQPLPHYTQHLIDENRISHPQVWSMWFCLKIYPISFTLEFKLNFTLQSAYILNQLRPSLSSSSWAIQRWEAKRVMNNWPVGEVLVDTHGVARGVIFWTSGRCFQEIYSQALTWLKLGAYISSSFWWSTNGSIDSIPLHRHWWKKLWRDSFTDTLYRSPHHHPCLFHLQKKWSAWS